MQNSQQRFWQARARLRRVNRDLGETAAFIAASLTTVTAIQAVISIAAGDKFEWSSDILQFAFGGYIVLLVLIFVLGAFRANKAIRRRARAEQEIDQTKKGIFDYCPIDEWPRDEE